MWKLVILLPIIIINWSSIIIENYWTCIIIIVSHWTVIVNVNRNRMLMLMLMLTSYFKIVIVNRSTITKIILNCSCILLLKWWKWWSFFLYFKIILNNFSSISCFLALFLPLNNFSSISCFRPLLLSQ